jgi:hypothetical protein
LAKEVHPHLHLFDLAKPWKYLIVGTFPPNTGIREKMYIDYFYGNKGFLWKIIHDLYKETGYDFFSGSAEQNLEQIKRWQHDYCVGLTDTIASCSRRHPLSSDDVELLDIEFNFSLKKYLLHHLQEIEKIIFTSSFGRNSAYENFKVIMGDDLPVLKNKLVIGLPSPSGSSNITFFNSKNPHTLGLTADFYEFVRNHHPEFLPEFEARWKIKQLKQTEAASGHIQIPATPKGLVKEYKLYRYREVLPQEKCR